MSESKQFTVLRVGANKRHFNVQRAIGGGLVNEQQETMIPSKLINTVLASPPNIMSETVRQAFKELKRIMETDL